MRLFAETITVFNYIHDTDSWHKSIIKGVQWTHYGHKAVIVDGVVTYTEEECITIDFERSYGNPTYLESVAFEHLADKTGYWTLNSKDKRDIVVLGEVMGDITGIGLFAKLKEQYQYCGIISAVTDNRNRRRLKHIEVVVK